MVNVPPQTKLISWWRKIKFDNFVFETSIVKGKSPQVGQFGVNQFVRRTHRGSQKENWSSCSWGKHKTGNANLWRLWPQNVPQGLQRQCGKTCVDPWTWQFGETPFGHPCSAGPGIAWCCWCSSTPDCWMSSRSSWFWFPPQKIPSGCHCFACGSFGTAMQIKCRKWIAACESYKESMNQLKDVVSAKKKLQNAKPQKSSAGTFLQQRFSFKWHHDQFTCKKSTVCDSQFIWQQARDNEFWHKTCLLAFLPQLVFVFIPSFKSSVLDEEICWCNCCSKSVH